MTTIINATIGESKGVSRVFMEGRHLLTQAFPIWKETHEKIDRQLSSVDMAALRAGMMAIA